MANAGCLCHAYDYEDTQNTNSEHHDIIDFRVGKEVGLGRLGHHGTSEISAGVRDVDLSAGSTLTDYARPDLVFKKRYQATTAIVLGMPQFHAYEMHALAERSFHGIGPSLGWNASAALAGNEQDGELALDWGIDGAILFGRQKAKTRHDTNAHYYYQTNPKVGPKYQIHTHYVQVYHNTANSTRSRRVTVPDVGGFIGLSLKFPNSKVSFGYRGEILFKAVDRGIDAAKKSNLTFNGPYASISIGLGD